jgi:hypothetical protein
MLEYPFNEERRRMKLRQRASGNLTVVKAAGEVKGRISAPFTGPSAK